MMYRYSVSRTAVICEYWEIEAESYEDLRQKLLDVNEPCHTEWIDWHGEWNVDEEECIDPLYQMIKQHKAKETA